MASTAYIKLVPEANKQEISLQELKELFHYYKDITSKTGEQLNWQYGDAAFPYELKEKDEANGEWFYLKGTSEKYNFILLGVGSEEVENEDGTTRTQQHIQVALPDSSTYGDKGKANEFCKFMAKKFNAELHLFNGRIMYFNK
ncbi:DUF1885 family protein [Bacillus sp. Marseille-P3661]|uniref:DUF1885 family protein n=1 Tax=Bacillus sp. Marseille-P3661 TaxID=1936234 RepID=UPI0015E1ADA3|nr:DUF1885 family protein [Bacillus sp. Marseille-P3661]